MRRNRMIQIFAFFCLAYYAVLAVYTQGGFGFSLIWLFGGILLLFLDHIIKKGKWKTILDVLPFWCKVGSIAVFIIAVLLFLIVEGCIVSEMLHKPDKGLDYIIVLGAQVKGEVITPSLLYRIERACEYLKENPDTKVVVSGGQGPGEAISEAEAMRRYLKEQGIADERILLEDRSTSTGENLTFSFLLIEEDASIGIVSNNFHIFRAILIGKALGHEKIQGVPAKSDSILFIHMMVREFFAIIKDTLTFHLHFL